MFSVCELPRVIRALPVMDPVHCTGGGLICVRSLSAMTSATPLVSGTTVTVPSAPPETFERTVASPDLMTIGSSVENVLTLDRSTTISPALSVLIVILPACAPRILPVSRPPFRNRLSSAATRPASARHSVTAHATTHSDRLSISTPPGKIEATRRPASRPPAARGRGRDQGAIGDGRAAIRRRARVRACLVLCVLELGSRLQRVLGGARQDDASGHLLEPPDRNRHIVRAHPEEAADADDRVGDGLVRRHDDVLDLADLLTGVVVDVLAEDLLLHAPSLGHFAQLRGRGGLQRRSRDLSRGLTGARDEGDHDEQP